jgi:hypothetical protein
MKADCPHCLPTEPNVTERKPAGKKLPWVALFPGLLAVLAPKCPMCLVAYVSAFGVTFGMASFALSALQSLAVMGAVAAIGLSVRHANR